MVKGVRGMSKYLSLSLLFFHFIWFISLPCALFRLGGEATKAATMEKMVKGVLGKILLQLLQIKQDGKQVG